jgi:phosphate transport system regulatory protein PhoU
MRHLEQELVSLRQDIIDMWKLTLSQVTKAGEAVLSYDRELALQVSAREKRVDAYELKIDSICENIIALYQPVAVDLRFVLASMKINSNLERIADFAYGMSKQLIHYPTMSLDADLITQTHLKEMFEAVRKMLEEGLEALENEKAGMAASIFTEDNIVDNINNEAPRIIANYIEQNPDRAYDCLQFISIFRKLERIGDHCSNIAEEIFFYLEAKVLKHSPKEQQ